MAKRPGRKRKGGHRHPSGQVKRKSPAEREDDVMGVAIWQRARRVGSQNARDQKAGYALGRLALDGLISEKQLEAGKTWARISQEFRWAVMAPPETPQSTSWIMVSSGFAPKPEGIEDAAERDKRIGASEAHGIALEALREADRERGALDYPATRIVSEVCCLDRDEKSLSQDELGELRIGLNALVKLFRLSETRQGIKTWHAA